jgi:hypothetical protein
MMKMMTISLLAAPLLTVVRIVTGCLAVMRRSWSQATRVKARAGMEWAGGAGVLAVGALPREAAAALAGAGAEAEGVLHHQLPLWMAQLPAWR